MTTARELGKKAADLRAVIDQLEEPKQVFAERGI